MFKSNLVTFFSLVCPAFGLIACSSGGAGISGILGGQGQNPEKATPGQSPVKKTADTFEFARPTLEVASDAGNFRAVLPKDSVPLLLSTDTRWVFASLEPSRLEAKSIELTTQVVCKRADQVTTETNTFHDFYAIPTINIIPAVTLTDSIHSQQPWTCDYTFTATNSLGSKVIYNYPRIVLTPNLSAQPSLYAFNSTQKGVASLNQPGTIFNQLIMNSISEKVLAQTQIVLSCDKFQIEQTLSANETFNLGSLAAAPISGSGNFGFKDPRLEWPFQNCRLFFRHTNGHRVTQISAAFAIHFALPKLDAFAQSQINSWKQQISGNTNLVEVRIQNLHPFPIAIGAKLDTGRSVQVIAQHHFSRADAIQVPFQIEVRGSNKIWDHEGTRYVIIPPQSSVTLVYQAQISLGCQRPNQEEMLNSHFDDFEQIAILEPFKIEQFPDLDMDSQKHFKPGVPVSTGTPGNKWLVRFNLDTDDYRYCYL